MLKLTIPFVLAGLVLASPVHAQEKPKAAPVLSEAEKASIDLLAVISQRDQALKDLGQCHAALTPLQARVREGELRGRIDALRVAIEKAHPGYKWDIEKGSLVPLPPKTAAAVPVEKK